MQYIYIEGCRSLWLSSCHRSVAEHWWLKPGVLGWWLPAFHFPLFPPHNNFQHKERYSKQPLVYSERYKHLSFELLSIHFLHLLSNLYITRICTIFFTHLLFLVLGVGGAASTKCLAQAQLLNWKVRNEDIKDRGVKRQWLREGLKPETWQMACHSHSAIQWTNSSTKGWATKDPAKLACLVGWVRRVQSTGSVFKHAPDLMVRP